MAKNFTTMMIMFMFCLLFLTVNSNKIPQKWTNDPTPKPWPEQFHSLLVSNNSNTNELLVINLWYDWINGRNLNIIQYQLGKKAHNVEHNNGTLYYYFTSDDGTQECRIDHFDVGILTPNWLQGANYLGQRKFDGFDCNVWEKVEFLWYYEDVVTQRPVCWIFYDGMEVHVMTFEVGAVLEDSEWQAPAYCFSKEAEERSRSIADRHSQQMLRGSVPLSLLAVV